MSETVIDESALRIIDAALDLFSETGYGSATVDDIARRAGVGVASLYRRWEDKAALGNAVYRSGLEGMALLYDDLESTTPKARFMELWQRVWDYAEQNPRLFLFVENHIHAAFIDEENVARKAELMQRADRLLHQIGIRADNEVVAAMVLGTIIGLTRSPSSQDSKAVGERIWAAVKI